MALSMLLEKAGHPPRDIQTRADVTIEKVEDGFKITRIDLTTRAEVPGMDEAAFQEQANAAKEGCPVSQALAGTRISLSATLKS
jgi:osmotically inducible protein OsmC